jgi:iron complex transport system substrate-binding protein
MKRQFNLVICLTLLLTLGLSACGTTATSTTAPTVASTIAPTVAPTTVGATATSAPRPTTAAIPTTALTSAATTAASTTQFPLTIVDGSGTAITVNKKPERIVCATNHCLDILLELGLEPVAYPKIALDFGAPYLTLPDMYGSSVSKFTPLRTSGADLSLEDVLQAKPDFIIGNTFYAGQIRNAIKDVPMFVVNSNNLNDQLEGLRAIGKITGRQTQAEQAIQKMQAKLEAYKAKAPKNKKVLYVQSYNFAFVPGTNSTTGSIIGQVAKYDWTAEKVSATGWIEVSLEKVLQVDPDVIFVGVNKSVTGIPAQLKDNTFWKEIKAVKNSQVFEVTSFYWQGVGTLSISKFLDEAMPKLYPDVFPKALP